MGEQRAASAVRGPAVAEGSAGELPSDQALPGAWPGQPLRLSTWRHISFAIYWLPISYLWSSLNAIILPYLILRVVPEASKGTMLGFAAGAGLLVAVFVQPLAGAASDVAGFRWGRRRPFVAVGSFFDLVFLVALVIAPSYWFLFLAYVALQIASNVAHGPYQGLIPDLVPEQERGRASGFMGLAQVLGVAGAALISSRFIAEGRPELAIGAIMAAIVVGALLTIWLVPDAAGGARGSVWGALRRTFDREVFNYPDFLWLLVSRFFILLGLYSVRDFAYYYVHDVLNMPNPAVATSHIMLWILAGSMAGVLPSGYLSDLIGRKRLVLASAALGVVGGFFFLTAGSYDAISRYGLVVGLAMGVFLSVDWAFATDLIPKSQAGRFLGISNVATAGASGASFVLGGPVIDIFNARGENQGYTALLLLVLVYFVIGTLSILKVREVVAVDDPTSRVAAEG